MKSRPTAVLTAAATIAFMCGGAGLLMRAQSPQPVGTWASIGAVTDSRTGAAAVALADGRSVLTGGRRADGAVTDAVAIYDPVTNSISATGRLLGPRTGHTATMLQDGRLLVAGGLKDNVASADLELFDLSSASSIPAATMDQPRTGHAAARLADGTVLIVGGSTIDGAILNSAELFDPSTGVVTSLSSGLTVARAGASATTLIDGRVLVAGGTNGTTAVASAEIYDPYSQTFMPVTTSLSVARSGHTAVLLPHNNGVLISGGTSAEGALRTADLFLPAEFPDPFSYGMGHFAPTGDMAVARSGAVSGPTQAAGYVFAMGGGPADAEVYRFATIKTDKDDYAPGERAIIAGSGWRPGEDVRLLFQEDPAVHDDYVVTVTADSEGNIYWDQWAPDEHDLNVRFYLMARDSVSRAQTTFTDGQPQTVSLDPTSRTVAPGNSAGYAVNVDMGGNTSTCTVTLALITGLPAGATASFTGGPNPFNATNVDFSRTLTITTAVVTPEGTYPFTVQAAKGSNCQGSPTGPTVIGTLIVDNTPPSATINQASGQADPTNASPITFTVTFSEPVGSFATGEVTLGGTAGATTAVVTGGPSTYNVAVSGMSTTGSVTASIPAGAAQDAAGNNNVASSSADATVMYDITAPDVPATPDLDAGSDSGSSDSDNNTNDTTPTFTGTAEAGATVEILVDGSSKGSVIAADGSYSITTSVLAQGVHNVTARATDAAGNASAASGLLSVTIDTAESAPSTPDLIAGDDSGSSNADNVTKVNAPSFTGIAAANTTVRIFVNGDENASGTTTDGSYSITTGVLAEGAHTIRATATDLAGNTSAPSGALTVTIDTSAPGAPSAPDLSASDDTGVSNTDNVTNRVVNLTFSGTAEPDSSIELVDGTASGSSNPGAGNWNITAAGPFSEGVHAFTARATDVAGNTSAASGAVVVTIDVTSPISTINQAIDQADPTAGTTISFTVDFSEQVSGFATGDVAFIGSTAPGTLVATVTGGPLSFNVAVSGMSAAGTVVASVPAAVATDLAGNTNVTSTSTDNTVTFVVDTTPPVITSNVTGTLGTNGWYTSDIAVTWTVTDPDSTVTSITGCDPSTVNTDTAGTTFTCSATSAGGTNSVPVTIMRDASAPNVPTGTRNPPANAAGWNTTDVTVTFSSNGDHGPSGVAFCTPDVPVTGETSGTNVDGTCTDAAGNVSSITQVLVKIDKTKPAITGQRTPAANAFGWTNTDVVVTFGCADSGTVQSGIAVNSVAGSTVTEEGEDQSVTNTGECVDVAGNMADRATVAGINIDTTAPVLALTFTPDAPDGNNGWWKTMGGVPYVWTCADGLSGIDPDYGGGCPSPANATVIANGLHSFNDQIRDRAGNLSTAVNRLLKLDNTPPTIAAATPPTGSPYILNQPVNPSFTCSDNVSGFASTGAALSRPGPGAADCAGPLVLDTSAVGSHSYGPLSATDAAGNSASPTYVNYHVHYNLLGLFAPWAAPPRAFKINSTIPLSWQYADYNGFAVESAAANPTPGILSMCGEAADAELLDIADAGASGLRYDAATRRWMYNWQTKGFRPGCYNVAIYTGQTGQYSQPFATQLR